MTWTRAALPTRALHGGGDGVGQASVAVADDQLHPVQAAVFEVSQELGPERFGLAVQHRAAEHLASPALTPVAITTAWATIRWSILTLQSSRPGTRTGTRCVSRPAAPGRDVSVELPADPADLALADPGAAHRVHQVIDPAGRDAFDVGILVLQPVSGLEGKLPTTDLVLDLNRRRPGTPGDPLTTSPGRCPTDAGELTLPIGRGAASGRGQLAGSTGGASTSQWRRREPSTPPPRIVPAASAPPRASSTAQITIAIRKPVAKAVGSR